MTAGHGGKLSRKSEQAIAALLQKPTIAEAAHSIGVSETSMLRWLQQPTFLRNYREARRRVVEGAVARLQKATGAAVECLERNLSCGNPPVEVAAAREILRQAVQAVEVWDLADRLEAVETHVNGTVPPLKYELVSDARHEGPDSPTSSASRSQ